VAGPAADPLRACGSRTVRLCRPEGPGEDCRGPVERRVVVQFGDGCAAVTVLLERTVPAACGRHVGIEAVLEAEVGD
jgi:hypothetical protein